jgi:excisionase family DNA binding protein
MAEQLAYRPDQLLREFPIGRTLLYELLASGELPSFRIGRARFIPRQAVLEYMERSISEQQVKAG